MVVKTHLGVKEMVNKHGIEDIFVVSAMLSID